jgi:small-conductance mechanosensitive channel
MAEEEKKKEITLEQAKTFRFILRVAFFLIALVVPCIVICSKFNIFTQATTTKWSILGITLLLIVGWRFKKRIGEWIDSWEDSNIFKWILIAIGRVWPFLLIVSILAIIHFSATKIIGNVLFCLEWTCVCELIAYLAIYPFEMKMDYLVKRMIRKNERKEDYKEAMREMKEEEKGE